MHSAASAMAGAATSVAITRAPRRAKPRANASPMPVAAPVITQTLPVRLIATTFLRSVHQTAHVTHGEQPAKHRISAAVALLAVEFRHVVRPHHAAESDFPICPHRRR